MLSRYDEARKYLDAARAAVIVESNRLNRERREREEKYRRQHITKVQEQLESMWW